MASHRLVTTQQWHYTYFTGWSANANANDYSSVCVEEGLFPPWWLQVAHTSSWSSRSSTSRLRWNAMLLEKESRSSGGGSPPSSHCRSRTFSWLWVTLSGGSQTQMCEKPGKNTAKPPSRGWLGNLQPSTVEGRKCVWYVRVCVPVCELDNTNGQRHCRVSVHDLKSTLLPCGLSEMTCVIMQVNDGDTVTIYRFQVKLGQGGITKCVIKMVLLYSPLWRSIPLVCVMRWRLLCQSPESGFSQCTLLFSHTGNKRQRQRERKMDREKERERHSQKERGQLVRQASGLQTGMFTGSSRGQTSSFPKQKGSVLSADWLAHWLSCSLRNARIFSLSNQTND